MRRTGSRCVSAATIFPWVPGPPRSAGTSWRAPGTPPPARRAWFSGSTSGDPSPRWWLQRISARWTASGPIPCRPTPPRRCCWRPARVSTAPRWASTTASTASSNGPACSTGPSAPRSWNPWPAAPTRWRYPAWRRCGTSPPRRPRVWTSRMSPGRATTARPSTTPCGGSPATTGTPPPSPGRRRRSSTAPSTSTTTTSTTRAGSPTSPSVCPTTPAAATTPRTCRPPTSAGGEEDHIPVLRHARTWCAPRPCGLPGAHLQLPGLCQRAGAVQRGP